MNEADGTLHYVAREVVGIFASPSALEAAVDELEMAGVSRAAVSILGADAQTLQPRREPLSFGGGDRR